MDIPLFRRLVTSLSILIVLPLYWALPASTVSGDAIPGTIAHNVPLTKQSLDSVNLMTTFYGHISESVNGVGENSGSGPITIVKPAGATVLAAFMAAATTPVSGGYRIQPGDVSIDGAPVTFSTETPSSIGSYNYWTDITSMVKPKIDAAPAGNVTFAVGENNGHTADIDGEILDVVFNDPNQTTNNTVALLFGAQNVKGDSFGLSFAKPINRNDPNLLLGMGLGISFGYQTVGNGSQFSYVNVDGQRLSSSAGGQDDCVEVPLDNCQDGELLTVGGVGDSYANPDPNASAATMGARTDDELYDIAPFVPDGATSATVFTQNPSNDDNIFVVHFFLRDVQATVVKVGNITLSPASGTQSTGSQATLTANVVDANGNPVSGRQVTFSVTSGPDAQQSATVVTDVNGNAQFSYTNNGTFGSDTVVASTVDSSGVPLTSNTSTQTFVTCSTNVARARAALSADATLGVGGSPLQSSALPAGAAHGNVASRQGTLENLTGRPLSFEPNRGQVDSSVRFLARGPGYTAYLTPDGAVLSSTSASNAHGAGQGAAVLRLRVLGGNRHAQILGMGKAAGAVNYLIGNNPHRWQTGLPTYARVEYRNIYPGIDLLFHGTRGQLEYDWVVRPGADPGLIRLRMEELSGGRWLQVPARLDRHGNLLIGHGSPIIQSKPVIYQQSRGLRTRVSGAWMSNGRGELRFQIGRYDRSKTLVIDPVLTYSTYLGGSILDVGTGITADPAGNAYVTGYTDSPDFPTANAYQSVSHICDAFVTKLSSTGALVYSTYLGGSDIDQGNAIAVDGSGNAYVTGSTRSTDFPTLMPYQSSNHSQGNGNAFVAKLDSSGKLVYSTYLGGTGDDRGNGIAVDGSGSAYVTGSTTSTDFPRMTPYQSTLNRCVSACESFSDAFVTKLGTGGNTLVYSTYLGGGSTDQGNAIAVDGSGNAYVTGMTFSGDFPTQSAIQGANAGSSDAFVTELNATGAAPVYSTYLGGAGRDQGTGIAVDGSGSAYVTGITVSANFPTTAGAFQTSLNQGTSQCDGPCSDAFVSVLKAAGSGIAGSTFLGGSNNDSAAGIAIGGTGGVGAACAAACTIALIGTTSSGDFPVKSTNHISLSGASDAFVAQLDPTLSKELFGSYLGGSGSEQGGGIGLDPSGSLYLTGTTRSADFPTTNAVDGSLKGPSDAFVTKLSPTPTAAWVSGFHAQRSGRQVEFRWRLAEVSGVAGFNLYAGSHRLNHTMIRVHVSRAYRYGVRWSGSGPYLLQVILTDGRQVGVRPAP